ncbi:hypothetical protein EG835_08520, partial [bacterium]|nr:hypothetical protein [bacterium]
MGLQALIPIRLIGPDGIHETAKSEDTLLDPSMRGTGAFAAMYAPILDRARETGLEAIWGFTGATKSFEKVGFTVPGVTRRLALPLSGGAAQLLEGRFRGSAGRLALAMVGKPAMWLVARAGQARCALGRRKRESKAPDLRIVTATAPPSGCDALMHAFIETWGGVTIMRDSPYLSWRVFSNPWTRPGMRCGWGGGGLVGGG